MKLNVNVKFEDTGRRTLVGNKLERGFVCDGLGSHDFWFGWEKAARLGSIETNQEPYCQVSYGKLSDGRFALLTYCEGDINRELCETEVDLKRAVVAAQIFYIEVSVSLLKVLDTLKQLLAETEANNGCLKANGGLSYSFHQSEAGQARRGADQMLSAVMMKPYGEMPPDGVAPLIVREAILLVEEHLKMNGSRYSS